MLNYKINFKHFEAVSKGSAVIASIGNQPQQALYKAASAIHGYFHRLTGFFCELELRGRCQAMSASQSNALETEDHHLLCSFAPFAKPNSGPPFFAYAKPTSMMVSYHSIKCFSSSLPNNLRHTSNHAPSSSQQPKLLQQADVLRYRFDKSFYVVPLHKIHKIPSKTSQLSTADLQTRPLWDFGNKGSIFFHCSSFIKRVYFAIGSPPNSLLYRNSTKGYRCYPK